MTTPVVGIKNSDTGEIETYTWDGDRMFVKQTPRTTPKQICYACGNEDRDTPFTVVSEPLCRHCHIDFMNGLDHLDNVVDKELKALRALKWLNQGD